MPADSLAEEVPCAVAGKGVVAEKASRVVVVGSTEVDTAEVVFDGLNRGRGLLKSA